MIVITQKAAEKAKEMLVAEGKDGWGLRIYNAGGGCCGPSYELDIDEKPSDDDDVVEKDGLKVFINKNTLSSLSGTQLDYHADTEREGFVLGRGFVLGGGSAPSCSSSCGSSCE